MTRKKEKREYSTLSVSRWAKKLLGELGAEGQPLCVIFEQVLTEYKEFKGNPYTISGQILQRLIKRQRSQQPLAGVIEDLLNYVEDVEKTTGHFIQFPKIDKSKDDN
jgi:hypothetical protein